MKEYLTSLVRAGPTPAQGRNVVREYLQARILGSLQRAGAIIPLAFHGGTALRFLYTTPPATPKAWISPWNTATNSMISGPICGPFGPR